MPESREGNLHKFTCFRLIPDKLFWLYRVQQRAKAVNQEFEEMIPKLYPSLLFPQFVRRPYRQTANRNPALALMTYQITGPSIQMRTQWIKPLNALQASELPRNQQLPRQRYVQKHTAPFASCTFKTFKQFSQMYIQKYTRLLQLNLYCTLSFSRFSILPHPQQTTKTVKKQPKKKVITTANNTEAQ